MSCKICGKPRYHSYAVCFEHYKERKNKNKKVLEKQKRKLDEIYGFSATKVNKKSEPTEDFWDINGTAIYCG